MIISTIDLLFGYTLFMVARTHNVVAFASLLTVAVLYPPKNLTTSTLVVCLIANTIGGMLPDIDQATSKLWGMLPFGNSIGKVLSKVFLSHRTFSHSLLGLFVTYKLTYWLSPMILNGLYINSSLVALALMIGFISHLLADCLTEEGLPLLFPLKYKFGFPPIKSWRIQTGHWFEKYIFAPGVVVYILIFAINNWSTIYHLL